MNNDGWLWVSVRDKNGWSKDEPLKIGTTDQKIGTTGAPALAVHNGKLYCVREGQGGSGVLWMCIFDGTTWSEDKPLDIKVGTSRRGFPPAALAVYRGELHCVHEGQHGDRSLWMSILIGSTWSIGKRLEIGTTGGCALAVVNDRLLCVHEGHGGDGWLWYSMFNGSGWTKDTKLEQYGKASALIENGVGTTGPPSLALHGHQVFITHQGQNHDGYIWGFGENYVDTRLQANGSDVGTSYSPEAIVFEGRWHLLHRGRGESDQSLWELESDGGVPLPPSPNNIFDLRLPDARPMQPYPTLGSYNTALTESQRLRDSNHPVDMTRHHIIPDSLLRRFWNQMLDSGDLSQARGLLTTIADNLGQYRMIMNPADLNQVRTLLQDIASGAIRHSPDARRHDAIDSLATVYEWMPGNLFIGPTGGGDVDDRPGRPPTGEYRREDDPGDGFETNARVVVGERAFRSLEDANRDMATYIRDGGRNRGLIVRATLALADAARRNNVYPVNPDNWLFGDRPPRDRDNTRRKRYRLKSE
jgi:hypothetical protein